MALTTYTNLKAACADWLSRGDLDQQIPDFIKLAEATLNKVIRSTRMIANADVTVNAANRKASVPADMIEPIYVTVKADEDYPLEQVSPEHLAVLRRNRLRAQGKPRYFAIIGRSIEVVPTPGEQTLLDMAYYQAIPTLTELNETNWLLTHEPDLYLYTTLLHAAPFLQDEGRAAMFGNLLAQQVSAAVQQNRTVSLDTKPSGAMLAAAPAAGPGQ